MILSPPKREPVGSAPKREELGVLSAVKVRHTSAANTRRLPTFRVKQRKPRSAAYRILSFAFHQSPDPESLGFDVSSYTRIGARTRSMLEALMLPWSNTIAFLGVGLIAFFVAGSLSLLANPPQASAATPNTINFQARLMNSSGSIVPDGTYNVEFKLYNASGSTGSSQGSCTGDANCLWTETRTGAGNAVTVANGYLTVNLGSVTALPTNIWNQQLWLSMRIGGANPLSPVWDTEMTPKLQLTAVPAAYALTNTNGSFSSSLSLQAPTVGNQTFNVLDQTAAGSYNICVQGATSNLGGCAPTTGGTGYIQNQNAGAQGTSNFWISGTGRADTALQSPSLDVATAGALGLGTGTATSVSLGKAGITTTNNGALTVTQAFTANGGGAFSLAAGKQVTVTATAAPTADQLAITNAGQAVTAAGGGVNNLSLNFVGGAVASENGSLRIDLQPGGTTGGTWNGVRFVANGTGPATGVTENGIKLEGPGVTGGAGAYNGININNIGTTAAGGTVRGINITATNSNAGGTVRAIQLNNLTAGAASEIGIDLGTGWDNLITYNNGATVLINGSGQFNGAQLQNGTVANAALTSSSLTVTAGSGLSGGGSVALGGSTTISLATTGVGAAFVQGGNSFGAQAVLGTNDNNSLALETNNVTRLTIDTSGNATLTGNLTVQGSGDSSINGNLTVGSNSAPTVINASSPLFAGSTPTTEFVTGTSSGTAFSDVVTLRHNTDAAAVQRQIGISLKLSNEGSSGESAKDGGILLESSNVFSNSPNLSLFTADTRRLTILSGGNVGIGTTNPGALLSVGASNQFQVSSVGAVTAVGVNSGAGLLQGALGLTVTGATASLNASSNFATNINTGTSTGTITLGGGSSPFAINSTAFDVSTAGALSGITGYTQSSGTATFNQNATDLFKIAALQAPTSDMAQITNSGFPTTTAGINGLQLDYYAALPTSGNESAAQRLNITNTSAVAGTISDGLRVVATGAVAGTTNGIKIDNFVSGAGGASALYIGTGWKDVLSYNGTQLISGAGLIQNSAFGTGINYSNITQVGALVGGSIGVGFGTINTNNNITTSTTVQGATINATSVYNLNGTTIVTAARAIQNVTGYTQSSGNATFNQNAADQLKVAALQAPTSDMVNITNSGFPITTTGINGQQIDYFANLGVSGNEAAAQRLNITNTSATAGTVSEALRIVATGAVAGTTNGIKIDNFVSGAGGASALYLGTGWKDLLSYNGTQLINGTGILQSAAVSGTYGNLTGTGALAAGSIASGFGTIVTTNTIQGSTFTSTIATGTAPLTVSSTTKVTNLNADLLDGLDSTAFAAASGSGSYIQNGTGVQTFANFHIRSAANGSVGAVIEGSNGQTADLLDLQLYNGTTSTTVLSVAPGGALQVSTGSVNYGLSVQQSGNPSAGNAIILANNTNVSPSGNLLDLQANNISKFNVTAAGTVTANGTLTASSTSNSVFGDGTTGGLQIGDGTVTKTTGSGFAFNSSLNISSTANALQFAGSNVLTNAALTFAAASANSISAAASQALNITANAASTWQATAGLLTVQGSTAGLTLTTATSGAVTLDSGTTGAINIGNNANAKTITIGNATGATSVIINTGTGALNLGTDAIAHTVNIGNQTGASAVTIDSGTGAINIGTSAQARAVNLGTGAAAQTVIVGSTNGTSTTTIRGGTGNVNLITNSASAGVIVQAQTDSTTAFQVQAADAAPIFNVDTTDTNLLANLNPGFEASPLTSWVAKGTGSVARSTVQKYTGNASGAITTTAVANAGIQVPFTFTASTQYTLSLYARLSSGAMSTFVIGRQDVSGTDIDCLTGQSLSNTGWTRFTCTFTTGATITSSNIYVKQSDAVARAGTIFLDSVQLQTGANTNAYGGGNIWLNAPITSSLALQNTSDSTTAFTIQNASGSATVLVADTLNQIVTIGGNNNTPLIISSSNSSNTVSIVPGTGAIGNQAYFAANSRARFGYNGTGVVIDTNGANKPISLWTGPSGNDQQRLTIDTAGGVTINGFSTAGIVTNTAAGLLGTVAVLPIANGGTNSTSANLTLNGVAYYDGTRILSTAASTGAQCLQTASSGSAPIWGSCGGGGGVTSLNALTGAVSIQGTANQITVTPSSPNITLSLPQNINTTAAVQFGTMTLQPAASLTNGQTGLNQTATLANATASGNVYGFQQTLTVTSTVAANNYGHKISLNDTSTAIGNTNTGISIALTGTNANRIELGENISVSAGVGIVISSTGTSGSAVTCNNTNGNISIGLCVTQSAGTGTGIYSKSTAAGASAPGSFSNDGSAVFGLNQHTGSVNGWYYGLQGSSYQTNSAAYTSVGVAGIARAASSATVYGGYFTLANDNTATLGAALYATTSTYSNVGGSGMNAVNVLQTAGGAGQSTTGTTGQVAGTGAAIVLTAGNGGTASAGSTNGNGGNITLSAGAAGAGTGTAGTNGSVIVKNQANSTTAFQIQNASGLSLLTTDTLNSQVKLNADTTVGTVSGNRLFSDGFESGNFGLWSKAAQIGAGSSFATDTTIVHNGKYSAKSVTAGAVSYQETNLDPSTSVYFHGYFYVSSHTGGNLDLMDFSRSSAPTTGETLYRDISNGHLKLWNNDISVGNDSGQVLTTGAWHYIEVQVTNGNPGTIQLWLDGTRYLNITTQNTGSNLFDILDIGETSTIRNGTVYYDDVSVDKSITTSTPSGSLIVQDSLHVGGTGSFGAGLLLQGVSNIPVLTVLDGNNAVLEVRTGGSSSLSQYIGRHAGMSDDASAYFNVGIGDQSLQSMNSGGYNVAIGDSTLNSNVSGTDNTAVGALALTDALGSSNTALGSGAGNGLGATGDSNLFLGYNAGAGLTSGDNNIIIGAGVDAANATGSNQLQIGSYISGVTGGGNSTSAFKIQDASSASILTVDTINQVSTYKGKITINPSAGTNGTPVFTDGFESGGFTNWNTATNVTADTGTVKTGTYSAKINYTSQVSKLVKNISINGTASITADVNYQSMTTGNADTLALLDVSGSTSFITYRDPSGTICFWNGWAATGTCSVTTFPLNQWHQLQMFATAGAGNTGSVKIYYDGTPIYSASNIASNPGAWGAANIGVATTSRAGVYFVDNVSVNSGAQGTPQDALDVNGTATFTNSVDTVSAYQFQNAAGTPVLDIDTVNSRVGIGTSTPSFNLDVQGVSGARIQTTTNSTTAFQVQNAASAIIFSADTSGDVIHVGSATTDTTQVLLQLDSFSTFADTATCSTSADQGSMYYNTSTNSVRSCINGAWEDLVSTAGLGIISFGVVADSGTGAGDLGGITGATNGPCRVSFLTTTTVKIVQGCTAYSGGRKIIIPDNTTPTGTLTLTSGNFVHVCLTGANGQPAFSASGTEAANQPTFSVNNPVLCLADIKAGAGVISNIYDVRTFTSTQKTFATLNATTGFLGAAVTQSATAGVVQLGSAIAQVNFRGVVVATAGSAAANNTVNMIIAYSGPQWVKATGTSAVNSYVQTIATSGYTSTAAVSTNAYGNIGVSYRTIDTLCTLTTNCQFSQFTLIAPR